VFLLVYTIGNIIIGPLQLWKGVWPLGGEIKVSRDSNWLVKILIKSVALFLSHMCKWTAYGNNDMFKLELGIIKHVIS